jgi:ribosomal protein S18 acetylase RimI-like enzyme
VNADVRETTAAKDFQFILELVERARATGEKWALSWTQPLLLSELQAARVFLAFSSGAPSGFILIRPPGAAWEITLTAGAAPFRKAGVFSRLLGAVLLTVRRDAPITEVHLEARADNFAAVSAYQSCGFVAVGRRRAYYYDGADAILFKLV